MYDYTYEIEHAEKTFTYNVNYDFWTVINNSHGLDQGYLVRVRKRSYFGLK